MTLKAFLEENGIFLSVPTRSKLGVHLKFYKPKGPRVMEDGYLVRNYEREFLESDKATGIMTKFLKKL